MDKGTARARLAFLEKAEVLKDTFRSGFTAKGRAEDTASHTWRLCLWILVFEDQFQDMDIGKLLRIAILHDLGEVVSGDIPATQQMDDKNTVERAGFLDLLQGLGDLEENFLSLWDEYNGATSQEALLIKGFDKLETILQHTQGENPTDFDYGFNLDYGQKWMGVHPIVALLRKLVDEKTKMCMHD